MQSIDIKELLLKELQDIVKVNEIMLANVEKFTSADIISITTNKIRILTALQKYESHHEQEVGGVVYFQEEEE